MNKKEKLLILFFVLLFPIINCDSITMEDDSAQEIDHGNISLATNSGYNLDGGDPNACVDSSTVTKARKDLVVNYLGHPVKEGTVSLKYSPTCNTFWAKIELTNSVSEDGFAQGEVVRFGNNKKTLKCNVNPGKTWCYTPQLYNDGSSFTGQIFLKVWGGNNLGDSKMVTRGDQTSAVQVAVKGGYPLSNYTVNGQSTGYQGYYINGDTWVHWKALGILGIKNLYHTWNGGFFEFPDEGGRTAPAKSINGEIYLVWADLSRNNDGTTRIEDDEVNGVWNFSVKSTSSDGNGGSGGRPICDEEGNRAVRVQTSHCVKIGDYLEDQMKSITRCKQDWEVVCQHLDALVPVKMKYPIGGYLLGAKCREAMDSICLPSVKPCLQYAIESEWCCGNDCGKHMVLPDGTFDPTGKYGF